MTAMARNAPCGPRPATECTLPQELIQLGLSAQSAAVARNVARSSRSENHCKVTKRIRKNLHMQERPGQAQARLQHALGCASSMAHA